MNQTRRQVSLHPSTIPYVDVVGIDRAIEGYNRLLILPQNVTIDAQIEEIKKQLIDKEVITEDHEGPIDVS